MKKIKLTPIDEEFDRYEDIDTEEGPHFEFDLTPYIVTCAMACGMLFVIRFARKHIFHMNLYS